jgi:hypothetical protein
MCNFIEDANYKISEKRYSNTTVTLLKRNVIMGYEKGVRVEEQTLYMRFSTNYKLNFKKEKKNNRQRESERL